MVRNQTPSPSFDVVVMACSIGALRALRVILSALPASFPAAVAIVQHMRTRPSYFVELLERFSVLPIRWAADTMVLSPGTVVVASPDRHLLVEPDGSLLLSDSEPINHVRPAADLLFQSAATAFGKRTIGVVLTGSGRDGALGARAVKDQGGRVIVQDETTSTSFQMPLAAIDTGAVDFVVPVNDIAATLSALVSVRAVAGLFQTGPSFGLTHALYYRRRQATGAALGKPVQMERLSGYSAAGGALAERSAEE
jgi:two-component system chemotaxis response regulator CheB